MGASECRLHTWIQKWALGASGSSCTPNTQRFPPSTSVHTALPVGRPHSGPDTGSLFESISGEVAAGSLGSAPNLLCDLGQVSGPLWASVSSSIKWDWGCLCRGLFRGWAKLQT